MNNLSEEISIRDLSALTGVNSVTLRAWERRYGLLKPKRNPKGHRFYNMEDVETVKHILVWLDRGIAISKVKPLLQKEQLHNDASAASSNDHWQEWISAIRLSAGQFRCEKLHQQMNELFSNYPVETLASNLFPKLFDELTKEIESRIGALSEKRFVETEIALRLHAQIHHQNQNNQGARLLVVVLGKDERHYQSLLFALALLEAGYRLHLLLEGCDLREIPLVVEKSGVQAVICYSDSKFKETQAEQEILRAAQHARVPFFVSGHCLDIHPNLANKPELVALTGNLRQVIQQMQHTLEATW